MELCWKGWILVWIYKREWEYTLTVLERKIKNPIEIVKNKEPQHHLIGKFLPPELFYDWQNKYIKFSEDT